MPKNYKTKLLYSTAVGKLQTFIDRAQYWNAHYSKYYRIVDVVLLGSLARNDTRVSDIDLCVKIERSMDFQHLEHKSDYLVWRKNVLGYADPNDFYEQLGMFEKDAIRYLKARDGRYDVLYWDQLAGLSLTLDPIVILIKNGVTQYKSAQEALRNCSGISHAQAQLMIEEGTVSRRNMQLTPYCNALSKYPPFIREMILKRDNSEKEYDIYVKKLNK